MPTTTTTKKGRNTTATTTQDTATSIAQAICSARTPSQKGVATRRKNAYVAERVNEGCDVTRVEANINRLCRNYDRTK